MITWTVDRGQVIDVTATFDQEIMVNIDMELFEECHRAVNEWNSITSVGYSFCSQSTDWFNIIEPAQLCNNHDHGN